MTETTSFKARIYEADSPFYVGELTSLIVPTVDGQYGIKARHRNLVVAIVPGVIKYRVLYSLWRVYHKQFQEKYVVWNCEIKKLSIKRIKRLYQTNIFTKNISRA